MVEQELEIFLGTEKPKRLKPILKSQILNPQD